MRILFVHNALRSFVRVDRDILASQHEVDELDLSAPYRIFSLSGRLARADLVFSWFASLHSLGPVLGASLFRKPSIVAVGGYDTANEPEIGYGHMSHPWKRYVVRSICDSATALVANSHAARDEVMRNTRTKTPIHVIYHGFDMPAIAWNSEREPIVLTIGNISRGNMSRKGHEVFVRAAAYVPEARFILVGRFVDDGIERLRAIAPHNVEFPGFLSDRDLGDMLSRASVYVQASMHEGFGCSLAEAMASGCVPVVSRRSALPEVAGPYGVYVERDDPLELASSIRSALGRADVNRREVAEYVEQTFPLERRRVALLNLVTTVGAAQVHEAVGN